MSDKLKIALQKSGRLSEKSLALLRECGIKLPAGGERKLRTEAQNFPMEVLFLRDDDIPQYVEQGVADIGILGQNEVWEKNRQVEEIELLGFGQCRLSLAIGRDEPYTGLEMFRHKRIATSYPRLLRQYFEQQHIPVEIEEIGGSVEIAPGIGLAEGIFDIVSTGSTLLMNGLREVETLYKSQAVLIAQPQRSPGVQALLDKLLFRIQAVRQASENKYILLNAPTDSVAAISAILPGMKSPSVLPLAEPGWVSLHSVIQEDRFWEIIDQLRELGAQGILVVPIEKMIL